ncbi:hypothetical protein TRFO_02569 [Tritrichomonas foetus]|uniref:Initiator binding domain-containing protein n=1 Tax=Tritrichomonas foetus TaxID=1144522 RepID=A0A1J4L281_9EUKA|nr:hypothetical protein TRFO_02569 [Tritrichomonas foetus]|eukprot:OHT17522.1 hypothetical protein TRFO_02569 [Tritrichomonas foetus]
MFANPSMFFSHRRVSLHPIPYDPFFNLLTASDQNQYLQLCQFFVVAEDRNKRNLGMPTFIKHLTMIHDFVNQGDNLDGIRGMLCGIHFGVNSFMINTAKLKSFMNRSKSCINGCFQKLGYNMVKPSRDITTLLTEIHPTGAPIHQASSRQWCVRRGTDQSPLCFVPSIEKKFAAPDIQEDMSKKEKVPLFYVDLESLLNHKEALDYHQALTTEIVY